MFISKKSSHLNRLIQHRLFSQNNSSQAGLGNKINSLLDKFKNHTPAVIDPASVPPPKFYANVCENHPDPRYKDYENCEIMFGLQDDYETTMKLGRGRYSEVYRAVDLLQNKDCVVKILKPVRKPKIRREIKILQHLKNGPFIIDLLNQVTDPSTRTPSLVFEYVDNQGLSLWKDLTLEDIQTYILQLLIGLDYAHSKGIIHRDIKPQNILIDHKAKQIRIADWGLADFYVPGNKQNVRVATRLFKGPELLLDMHYYDYQLDIWSTGCMLAGMVFQKEPFFRSVDNNDHLIKIAKVLGTSDIIDYVNKFNMKINPEIEEDLDNFEKQPWETFINSNNTEILQPSVRDDAFDLLTRMLTVDHTLRITAREAIQHQFFQNVRKEVYEDIGIDYQHQLNIFDPEYLDNMANNENNQ